ncbi:cytochrome ubiquinol oxidase subunit I, partial [Plantactinospora sp. ZYX-F-223]
TLHTVSTIGSFVLGTSTLFFIYNVWKSWRFGRMVDVDDPWGFGNSLEWATTCPPPLRNFDRMPQIRSERPAFDAKYGPLVADLGRDLPQRAAEPPQRIRDELHRGRTTPEPPMAEGAQQARETVAHYPPEQSGARPVQVPEPEEVRRPSFEQTDEATDNPFDAERTGPSSKRWRDPPGGKEEEEED